VLGIEICDHLTQKTNSQKMEILNCRIFLCDSMVSLPYGTKKYDLYLDENWIMMSHLYIIFIIGRKIRQGNEMC
jgi:hypothetical protein